jgi:3-methyladenine DNA glycosylase Tag
MNYKLELLIIKNRAKLEQMIKNESDYNKIVKQSQRLDRYLNMKMRELVK